MLESEPESPVEKNFPQPKIGSKRSDLGSYKKSNKRAPGPSPDHGTIWGAQGFPVRLIDRVRAHQGRHDLTADGAPAYPITTRFISCGSRTSVAG